LEKKERQRQGDGCENDSFIFWEWPYTNDAKACRRDVSADFDLLHDVSLTVSSHIIHDPGQIKLLDIG
jgi:hypothetical protein